MARALQRGRPSTRYAATHSARGRATFAGPRTASMETAMFTKKIAASLVPLLLLAGCASASPDQPTSDAMLGAPEGVDTAALGFGADTSKDEVLDMLCLDFTTTEVGTPISDFSMDLDSDREQMKKALNISASAKYGGASANAKFVEETETDSLSASYLFNAHVDIKCIETSSVSLSMMAGDIKTPTEFHDKCGDGYVKRLKRGASLYAALKITFDSEKAKQEFESDVSLDGGIAKASASIKSKLEKMSTSAHVDVRAVQIGGDPAGLMKAVGGADGAGCSKGNFDACVGYINSVQGYAGGAFADQFKGKSPDDLTRVSAITGYDTASWNTIVVPALKGTDRLSGNAQKLWVAYKQQSSDNATLDRILNLQPTHGRSAAMKELQRKQIETVDQPQVGENLTDLEDAFFTCFPQQRPETAACTAAANAALAKVKPLAKDDLVPWYEALDGDRIVKPSETVDLFDDGKRSWCRPVVEGGGIAILCQLGVGKGFEPNATGMISPVWKMMPTGTKGAWSTLAGHAAWCTTPKGADPHDLAVIDCAVSNGKEFVGTHTAMKPMIELEEPWELGMLEGRSPGLVTYDEIDATVKVLKDAQAWPYDRP